jgi:hypothetical protein
MVLTFFLVLDVYHGSSIRRKPLEPGQTDYFRKKGSAGILGLKILRNQRKGL